MIEDSEQLLAGPLPEARVGIGRGTDRGYVEAAAAAFDDVTVYDDAEALVSDLVTGRIDAAVRGDMPSDVVVPILRRELGLKRLERSVILQPAGGRMFIIAPVGIDEGWTPAQKADVARRSCALARRFGADDRIAVMSGGRDDDRGRCPQVDRTIDSAEAVVSELVSQGYDAYDCQILLEDAVRRAGIVIAPDGISGNIIFRALHFIGGAKALGAPVVNTDLVFVDTSRAKTDYRDSIALAKRLTEGSQ